MYCFRRFVPVGIPDLFSISPRHIYARSANRDLAPSIQISKGPSKKNTLSQRPSLKGSIRA